MKIEKTAEEILQEQEKTSSDIMDFLGLSDTEVEDEETEETVGETVDESEDVVDDSDSDESDDSDDGESDDDGDETSSTDEDDSEEADEETEDTDEELTELERTKEQVKKLTELIESQALQALGQVTVPAKKPTSTPEPKVETPVETEETSVAEMLGEVDFEELREDPEKFVAFIGKVIETSRKQTINELQGQLPQMVNDRTTQAIALQKLVDDFYRDNSALAGAKQTVSIVARNVGVEHPDWDMKQILDEAGKRTRTMLGIKAEDKPRGTKPVRKGKKPAVPTKTGGKRRAAPKKVSKQQKQINEIIDLL